MSRSSRVCEYDEHTDIQKVVSGLSPDINDMLRTGIVYSGSVNDETNGIDEPGQIIGLVRDEFAAIDAMRIISKYGRKSKSAVAKAQSNAVADTGLTNNTSTVSSGVNES